RIADGVDPARPEARRLLRRQSQPPRARRLAVEREHGEVAIRMMSDDARYRGERRARRVDLAEQLEARPRGVGPAPRAAVLLAHLRVGVGAALPEVAAL